MFTTIRQYRCDPNAAAEIARRADEHFADQLADMPGFVAYELVDCGSGDLFTTTVFTDQASAERSSELAAEFIRRRMPDIDLTRTGSFTGQVLVNRATSDMLHLVHA